MDEADIPSTSAPALEPRAVEAPAPTDAIIETWFVETFHNQGLDAPLFNRYRAAADALKVRLRSTRE